MKPFKTLTIGQKRLLKLARHLRKGKLIHEVFDFGCFNSSRSYFLEEGECGTNGCALGECPALWKSWKFTGIGSSPHYRRANPIEGAQGFFGVTFCQAIYLFLPSHKRGRLPYDATKEQVAGAIERFVRRHS